MANRPPSITSWTRLEPRARDPGMRSGLEARVRDPLWMLTRQWQLGELTGEDAGSPVSARISATAHRVTRIAVGSAPPRPIDVAVEPMERAVEAESPPLDARAAAEAGEELFRLLAVEGAAATAPLFLAAYPHPPPDAGARARMDAAEAGFVDALLWRIPDAERLHTTLAGLGRATDGSLARLPASPAIPHELQAAVRRAGGEWLDWWDALHPSSGSAWLPEHMEYGPFVASARLPAGEIALGAPTFTGGTLDWHRFDVRPGPALGAVPSDAALSGAFLPASVSFPGMPAPRFWEMEDAAVDLGAIGGGPGDLARLLVTEFALVYGNDWFRLPLEVPHGSIVTVESLVVADSFGLITAVDSAAAVDASRRTGARPWRIFTATGGDVFFFAAPETGSAAGSPIEDVLLVRDEMANVVWGIERVAPGFSGPVRRDERWRMTAPSEPGAAKPLSYRLGGVVPEYWIPFVAAGDPVLLQRAHIPGIAGGGEPLGEVLGDPDLRLHQNEIPREGTRVRRRFRFARGAGGRAWTWLSRVRTIERGDAASGLEFDRILDRTAR